MKVELIIRIDGRMRENNEWELSEAEVVKGIAAAEERGLNYSNLNTAKQSGRERVVARLFRECGEQAIDHLCAQESPKDVEPEEKAESKLPRECPRCKGLGVVETQGPGGDEPCQRCGGRGKI